MGPTLLQAVAPVVSDGHPVLAVELALLAPQRLTPSGREPAKILVPAPGELEIGAAPERCAPGHAAVPGERGAQPRDVGRILHEVAEDQYFPGQGLQRRDQRA